MGSVSRAALDQKLAMAKRCSHEGVVAGAKAAVVASVAAAVPTLASVRMLPWARSNLNPTAQALIISTGSCTLINSQYCYILMMMIYYCVVFMAMGVLTVWLHHAVAGAAYFIVADKTVLASARKNSFKDAHHGKN
ncbi:Early nodulin-93 [Canna indica]|uniref:Early nodulin-93 n=1 Tax=Canna indica TaxID=4628 RepID=A0AAQ3Q581_9LILI|nr:Early nodulin-93 [Canna indica]